MHYHINIQNLLAEEPISLARKGLAPFNLAAYCEVMNMFYNPLHYKLISHLVIVN